MKAQTFNGFFSVQMRAQQAGKLQLASMRWSLEKVVFSCPSVGRSKTRPNFLRDWKNEGKGCWVSAVAVNSRVKTMA
jgi:hypothetical protein